MNIITYGLRQHKSTLEQSLQEQKQITKEEFNKRLKRYHLYIYDQRCSQILFIANDIQNEIYTWMYIQMGKEDPTWKQFKEDQTKIIIKTLQEGLPK